MLVYEKMKKIALKEVVIIIPENNNNSDIEMTNNIETTVIIAPLECINTATSRATDSE